MGARAEGGEALRSVCAINCRSERRQAHVHIGEYATKEAKKGGSHNGSADETSA